MSDSYQEHSWQRPHASAPVRPYDVDDRLEVERARRALLLVEPYDLPA